MIAWSAFTASLERSSKMHRLIIVKQQKVEDVLGNYKGVWGALFCDKRKVGALEGGLDTLKQLNDLRRTSVFIIQEFDR